MSMENDPKTAHTPATKGDLEKLEGKIVGKMEHLLSEQIKATDSKMEHLFSQHTKATEQKLDGVKKDMEQLLADQANVILEAVDELVEKKLDKKLGEKFDPVITKLDAVLKQFEDHRDEDIAGAEQLRRHENQLVKLEARVGTLEIAATS